MKLFVYFCPVIGASSPILSGLHSQLGSLHPSVPVRSLPTLGALTSRTLAQWIHDMYSHRHLSWIGFWATHSLVPQSRRESHSTTWTVYVISQDALKVCIAINTYLASCAKWVPLFTNSVYLRLGRHWERRLVWRMLAVLNTKLYVYFALPYHVHYS